MTIEEIKQKMREAKDAGDNKAFADGLKLLRDYHPDVFQKVWAELENLPTLH